MQIGENVSLTGSGIAQFAVAANGTLVYTPAQPRAGDAPRPRRCNATPLSSERRNFHMPRFSPDGNTIALDFPSLDGRDVWTLDRATSALSRVTADRDAHDPVWSRDGRELFYTSFRRGSTFGVYPHEAGLRRDDEDRGGWTRLASPACRSRRKSLIAQAVDFRPGSQSDIVRIDSAGRVTPVVAESYDEGYREVSPDGRWLAYASTLSGGTRSTCARSRARRSGPGLDGGATASRCGRAMDASCSIAPRARATRSSGRGDRSRAGRSVSRRDSALHVDEYDAAQPHANYDVSPDGKIFVMIHRAPTGRLTVIQNLPELVRRLSGAKQR